MDNKNIISALIQMFTTEVNTKEKAINSNDIILHLQQKGIPIKGNKLRAIIGDLRKDDTLSPQFILSSVDDGYWLSDDIAEMDAYLERQMYRMSHQYDNIQSLHQRRRRERGNKTSENHQMSFAL